MKKEMLINVLQPEECRIAILEDGVLEELYVERTSHESYVGNIYKGRIVNIEPSIQAAFVDFGVGRNGFLHVSDVEPTYYRHLEQRDGGGHRGHRGGGGGRGRGPRRPPRDEDDMPRDVAPAVDDFPEAEAFDELEPIDTFGAESEATPGEVAERELPGGKVEAPEETSGPREERGRRRGGRGRGRRDRSGPPHGGERRDAGPPPELPSEESPSSPRDDGPRLMDSAEHRTDQGQTGHGPIAPREEFTDEDLSFSAARREPEASEPVGARRAALEHAAEAQTEEQGTPPPEDSHEEEYQDLETADTPQQFEQPEQESFRDMEEEEDFAPRRREGRRDDRREGRRDDRRGPRRGPRRMMGGRPGSN